MTLIDGKAIAQKIQLETLASVDLLKASGRMPGLAVVLVGEDPASRAYVRSKDRMCQELGMHDEWEAYTKKLSKADAEQNRGVCV